MDTHTLDRIAALIAEHEATMAAMRADKPAVTDGHSDGKRVRYVRHETAAATLRAVADMLRTDTLLAMADRDETAARSIGYGSDRANALRKVAAR